MWQRRLQSFRGLVTASASVQSRVPAELEKIIGGFQMVDLPVVVLCQQPEALTIHSEFLQVPDPKIKYQQLLFYAKKLKPMAAALHTEENKVQGCVSQD